MYKFFTDDEVDSILNNKRIKGTNEKKLKRIKHIDDTDALFVRFERMINFTYKNRKNLVLHYPSIKINNEPMIQYGLKRKLPMIGNIFLSKKDSTDIIPFAECIIKQIFLPNEIVEYWNMMIERQENSKDITFYNIYNENIKKYLSEKNPELNEAFEMIFQQFNYDDKQLRKIIKINDAQKVHTRNSALLWIRCDILEYYTASHLIVNNNNVSYSDYLTGYKFYEHSLAYGLPKSEYFKFKQHITESPDYCVSKDAVRKAFVYLDETTRLSALDFKTRYKVFSEEAWRDLLCKEQFIYTDNDRNEYLILFHMIFEIKYGKKFNLIDYDTEVRCFNETNKNRSYYIDAYLHFYFKDEQRNIKFYMEFKNYTKTIYEDEKDYLHQPKAILNNNFYTERYKHEEEDEWYYVAVTKGSPYEGEKGKNMRDSGVQAENYLDFEWKQVFDIMETKVQEKARKSIDGSLGHFLKFIERI